MTLEQFFARLREKALDLRPTYWGYVEPRCEALLELCRLYEAGKPFDRKRALIAWRELLACDLRGFWDEFKGDLVLRERLKGFIFEKEK